MEAGHLRNQPYLSLYSCSLSHSRSLFLSLWLVPRKKTKRNKVCYSMHPPMVPMLITQGALPEASLTLWLDLCPPHPCRDPPTKLDLPGVEAVYPPLSFQSWASSSAPRTGKVEFWAPPSLSLAPDPPHLA